MDGLRLGVYDHLGWAVAVVATADGEVVERRRIELVEPATPVMPIHHPEPGLDLDGVRALVARVRASAERATRAALGTLPAGIASIHLRAIPTDFPTDLAVQLRAPYDSRADAVMYRAVLAEAATARGWRVAYYDAKAVAALAATLHAWRERLGPPWTKDHRTALAAVLNA